MCSLMTYIYKHIKGNNNWDTVFFNIHSKHHTNRQHLDPLKDTVTTKSCDITMDQ